MEMDEVKKKKKKVYDNVRYMEVKTSKIQQSYII